MSVWDFATQQPLAAVILAGFALAEPTFVGNFRGWAQRRKFIAHEDNFAAVLAGREAVAP